MCGSLSLKFDPYCRMAKLEAQVGVNESQGSYEPAGNMMRF